MWACLGSVTLIKTLAEDGNFVWGQKFDKVKNEKERTGQT